MEQDIKTLGTGALAFVGDAVYSLFVREKLAEINRPVGALHSLSVNYVRAPERWRNCSGVFSICPTNMRISLRTKW